MTFDVTDREGIGIDSNGVRLRYFFILLAVLDRVPEIQTFHAFYWKQSLTIRRFGGVGMIRSATIGRKDGGLPMGGRKGLAWETGQNFPCLLPRFESQKVTILRATSPLMRLS
jgi:hypothetical protein